MINDILHSQKTFFQSQQTKDISFRKNSLIKLKKELLSKEAEIIEALNKDFKKSKFESVMSETSIVLAELSHTIKKLKKWAKPQSVMPSMLKEAQMISWGVAPFALAVATASVRLV